MGAKDSSGEPSCARNRSTRRPRITVYTTTRLFFRLAKLRDFVSRIEHVRRVFWASLPVLVLFVGMAQAQVSTRRGNMTFVGGGHGDSLFVLPATWVLPESLFVFRNGKQQSEYSDWRRTQAGNAIWLYRPLLLGDSLAVEFSYLPYPMTRSYARHLLREVTVALPGGDTVKTFAEVAVRESEQPGWSELRKSGSLLRSVSVGTDQDLAMESALNLQLSGKVGRDVDVVAVLTDQSSPIEPEGTTETLQELDKVYVQVQSPHLIGTLGDYTLDLPGGRYDTYVRKLSGVQAVARWPATSATAAGAVSEGEFYTNNFMAQENNQGPYTLIGKNGESGVKVLAGTERVWLDGELLTRGEGNDYVIDYSSGQIAFTSKHLMTSDRRIVVDFEYATERFQKFYGAARAEGNFLRNRLSTSATWLDEADDRGRPLLTSFTEEDRAVLTAAGDDALRAIVPSADSIGPGKGDYTRKDTLWNGSTYSIFVIAARDSLGLPQGEWRVTFDDFGQGNGDYELVVDSFGQIYYRWIGPAAGRYLPQRKLPLPTDHQLGDFRLDAEPITGIRAGTEIALSRFDENTYSSLDDEDNNGVAVVTTLELEPQGLRIGNYRPDYLRISGSLRHRDERFRDITRSDVVEFQREWDTERVTGIEETVREVAGQLRPVPFLSFAGEYGELSRGNQFQSLRRTGQFHMKPFGEWEAGYRFFHLTSDDSVTGRSSRWTRQQTQAAGKWWRFRPRGGLEWENRRDNYAAQNSGFRFLEWHSGLGVELPEDVTVDGEYRRRLDDGFSSSRFFRFANAYTASAQARWYPSSLGRMLLRYAHREKDYTVPDSADVVAEIARWEAFFVPQSRLFEANWTYELASTRLQSQVLVALEVTPGTGNYRREGGGYVPDDQGDIVLVPRNTGLFVPVTEIRFASLFWLRFDEAKSLMSLPTWLHPFSSETELQIDEQTREKPSLRLFVFDPSVYRGDSTLYGNLSIREDIHFQRLSPTFSTRLRYRYSTSLQNQYLNGGEERRLHQGALRVRAVYWSGLRGTTEISGDREFHFYRMTPLPSREIRRASFDETITYSISSRWEAGADLGSDYATDRLSRIEVTLFSAAPRLAYMLLGRGRVDGEVRLTYARSSTETIPFELASGANRGANWRWELTANYQFARNFSGSLTYSGRADKGERTYHMGRVEARASF
jgi:hypothetical protein